MLTESTIADFLQTLLGENDLFLVEVVVSPGKVLVEIDKDKGVMVSDCEKVNRALRSEIGEEADNIEIQVSSPGLDKPLRVRRQYQKNMGRDLVVTRLDQSKVEGTLTTVEDDSIILHREEKVKQGKKKVLVSEDITIPFSDIKESKIIVKF